jgi:lipoate---protein ligase
MVASFRFLDLTLPSPVENLALDEALLDDAEVEQRDPVVRVWESRRYFVVLGRSSSMTDDVHVGACREDGIPILRRASGGGTVLQGPGCLCYAFVLPMNLHSDLHGIRSSNTFILSRLAETLCRYQPGVMVQGISDLAIDGRKISGNAQRRTRNALLFHGTLLYRMQPGIIARYLRQPTRQPDYRHGRRHDEFLRTIDAPVDDLRKAIADAWHADRELESWPIFRMPDAVARVVERSPQAEHECASVARDAQEFSTIYE